MAEYRAIGAPPIPDDPDVTELADQIWDALPQYGCDYLSLPMVLVLKIHRALRLASKRRAESTTCSCTCSNCSGCLG